MQPEVTIFLSWKNGHSKVDLLDEDWTMATILEKMDYEWSATLAEHAENQ